MPITEAVSTIVIYADGACEPNPGTGGYGAVIQEQGERREVFGGCRRTTNNRMELLAVISGLERLNGASRPVVVYSDSTYVVNGIAKGWAKGWRRRGWRRKKGPVRNLDLWQRLLNLTETRDVTLRWVRGHNGNPGNERADQLAEAGMLGGPFLEDTGYTGRPS